MNANSLDEMIKIRHWGTIVIANSILCDGPNNFGMDDGKNIACYTHIHDDHICGLSDALGRYKSHVYATKITKQLSSALLQCDTEWIKDRTNYVGLDYDETTQIDNFEISFKKTHHILGSAQLLVNTKNKNILYSSDFILQGTDIVKNVDYLILDSTHGKHSEHQTFDNEITSKTNIINKARELLDSTKQMIISANRGTMQLTMSWLRAALSDDIIFLAKKKDASIAEIYSNHGYYCGEIEDDKKFDEYRKNNTPCILFQNHGSGSNVDDSIPLIRIGSSTLTSIDNDNSKSIINLQEHATISEVCDYVKAIEPKHIILDNSTRINNPKNAQYLKKILTELDFSVSLSPKIRMTDTI